MVDNGLRATYIAANMKRSGLSRFVTAIIALLSMLFMQLALASYACPDYVKKGPEQQELVMSTQAAMPSMDACMKADPSQPSLCNAHGQQVDRYSLDKPQNPPVQAFAPAGWALPLHPIGLGDRATPNPLQTGALSRATAPPVAIRHCCFRI